MKLEVLRFSSQKDSTSGALFLVSKDKKEFLCYTLEDEFRTNKVRGETRIPAGSYKLEFRKVDGFHGRYARRFPEIHKGMLEVTGVPNFNYVLIHCGNDDDDTSGCLLVGNTQTSNLEKASGFIGSSTSAYKKIYPPIAEALEMGEEVIIEYIDYA